jgi:Zn-dependent protease with chaperone function
MVGAYGVFRSSKSSFVRTYSLLSMMAISSSLWLFVISSLVLCSLMINQYWVSPVLTSEFVLRLALLITLAGGPSLILLFRGRAIKKVYAAIQRNSIPVELHSASMSKSHRLLTNRDQDLYDRSFGIFSSLRNRIVDGSSSIKKPVSLNLLNGGGEERGIPESLAVDWRGYRMVGIKQGVASILQDDELEGVLAHELGHIEQGDARAKSIATGFRISFPFDPLVYFVEAAIYRERELAADEFSARLTGKPASLASALLKIYEGMRDRATTDGLKSPVGVSYLLSEQVPKMKIEVSAREVRGRTKQSLKILSKQPSLKLRIERLLDITNSLAPTSNRTARAS